MNATTKLSITVTERKEFVLLRLSGSLIGRALGEFRDALDAVNVESTRVVVDLSGVPLFTSSGLEVLIAYRKAAETRGVQIVVISSQESVRDMFEISGCALFFPVFADMRSFLHAKGLPDAIADEEGE